MGNALFLSGGPVPIVAQAILDQGHFIQADVKFGVLSGGSTGKTVVTNGWIGAVRPEHDVKLLSSFFFVDSFLSTFTALQNYAAFANPENSTVTIELRPVCIGQGFVETYVWRTVEQIVDVSVSLVMEEKAEVVRIIPRCFSERIIEQRIVDSSWMCSFHGLCRLRILSCPSALDRAWHVGTVKPMAPG